MSRPSVTVTPAPVIQEVTKPPVSMVTVLPRPPAPSRYVSPTGGLSPEALLRHASDYGAWCQGNADKLEALKKWFWPEGKDK